MASRTSVFLPFPDVPREVNQFMLLAEALVERAAALQRLAELRRRIGQHARVQEGETPSEDAPALLDEAEALTDRLRELVVAINVTNAATVMPDGGTVTAALARRDQLGQRVRLLREAADRAAEPQFRMGRAELRTVATLDVAALRVRADEAGAAFRALDVRLQQVNWTTQLADVD